MQHKEETESNQSHCGPKDNERTNDRMTPEGGRKTRGVIIVTEGRQGAAAYKTP